MDLSVLPINKSEDILDALQLPTTPGRKQLKEIFDALKDINLEGKIVDRDAEQFGLGSSCDIFLARSTAHRNIYVAVKRIRHFLLDDLSFASSLGREIRLWSKLKHPNVLPLLGYFLEGPKAVPNLVSKWMRNGTVVEYMSTIPFDARKYCTMISGIASGLAYIHDNHNIVHADLKGSNILVSDRGRPLLADFGLSVSTSSASLNATTYHGQKGSLRWMAKELHAISFDAESMVIPKHTKMTDMWSFGMVIAELVTQNVPYASVADRLVPTVILDGQLPQEPVHRTIRNSFVLRGLWSVARDCWNVDPLKRPTSSQVHDELREFSKNLVDDPTPWPDANLKNSQNGDSVAVEDLIEDTEKKIAAAEGVVHALATLEIGVDLA